MKCIYCNGKTKVTNTRPRGKEHSTWRRRECLNCNAIVTSEEAIKLEECLLVKKKNGDQEPFLRDKLFISIFQSIDHLPKQIETAHYLCETILRHCLKTKPMTALLSSENISITAIRVLKNFDAASAIKYNSYRTNLKLPNDVRRALKFQ